MGLKKVCIGLLLDCNGRWGHHFCFFHQFCVPHIPIYCVAHWEFSILEPGQKGEKMKRLGKGQVREVAGSPPTASGNLKWASCILLNMHSDTCIDWSKPNHVGILFGPLCLPSHCCDTTGVAVKRCSELCQWQATGYGMSKSLPFKTHKHGNQMGDSTNRSNLQWIHWAAYTSL